MSTAENIFAQVAAGKTVFTKAADTWMIIGPAASITQYGYTTVTKADGTTTDVHVQEITQDKEVRGIAYRIATIYRAAKAANATATYRTVKSPVYGNGRVYSDQAGATQYQGTSGRFNVQIWDES